MGNKLRLFFRALFGSRLVEHLEVEMLRLRSDMEQRLQDKDRTIADLRTEKAELLGKIIIYEQTLLPRSSRAGADLINSITPRKPNFGLSFAEPRMVSAWEQVQLDHEKELAEQADREAEAAKAKGA